MSAELVVALNKVAEETRSGLDFAVAMETACGNALPVGTVVANDMDGVFTILAGASADVVAVLCRPGEVNAYSGYTGNEFMTTTEAVLRVDARGIFVPLQRTVLVGYDPAFHVYSEQPAIVVPHNGNMANPMHKIGRTVVLSTGSIWIPTQQLCGSRADWRAFLHQFGKADSRVLQAARRLQQNKRTSLQYRVRKSAVCDL